MVNQHLEYTMVYRYSTADLTMVYQLSAVKCCI